MAKFKDSWSKAPKQGLMEKFTDAVKPKGALKPRVETAVKRLQAQIGKMDGMVNKLKQRDQDIFQKIVVATQQHDTYSSKVLSNELVEVRNRNNNNMVGSMGSKEETKIVRDIISQFQSIGMFPINSRGIVLPKMTLFLSESEYDMLAIRFEVNDIFELILKDGAFMLKRATEGT